MIAAIGADSLRTGNTRRCGEDERAAFRDLEVTLKRIKCMMRNSR